MNKAKPKARSNTKKKQKLHTREDCLSLAQRLCKYRTLLEYGRLWCIACDKELTLGERDCQGGHYISRKDRQPKLSRTTYGLNVVHATFL